MLPSPSCVESNLLAKFLPAIRPSRNLNPSRYFVPLIGPMIEMSLLVECIPWPRVAGLSRVTHSLLPWKTVTSHNDENVFQDNLCPRSIFEQKRDYEYRVMFSFSSSFPCLCCYCHHPRLYLGYESPGPSSQSPWLRASARPLPTHLRTSRPS